MPSVVPAYGKYDDTTKFQTSTLLSTNEITALNLSWSAKAELPQEGILFCTQFPSLGIFINKMLDFEKTKAT